ncbi:MAG: hypothetical protein ABJG68_02150 [Crocinitomicaceae bacterium]
MNQEGNKLYYRPVVGRVYIAFGILFIGIFIMGAIILEDYINLIYAVASSFLIYIGFNIIKQPYAQFDENSLILFSFYGKTREKHKFSSKNELKFKNKHVYIKGKKIKLNSWFIQQSDWRRFEEFYATDQSDQMLDVLQD